MKYFLAKMDTVYFLLFPKHWDGMAYYSRRRVEIKVISMIHTDTFYQLWYIKISNLNKFIYFKMYLILVYLAVELYASMVPIYTFQLWFTRSKILLFLFGCFLFCYFFNIPAGHNSKWKCPTKKNPGLKLCNWDSIVKISVIV